MARVAVVGAGVGGLAVAARLAAAGHRVQVHERADTHGGKLGVYRRGGFTFDTGPSLLTMPEVLTEVFTATGGPSGLDVVPVDPACVYRFADGTRLAMPHDPAAVARALDEALGPGSGAAWQRLHARSARLWALVADDVLRRPRAGPADLVRFARRPRDLRLVAPWRTLRGLGGALLPDPRLRTWLDRYATYSGSDPRRTPAVLSVTAYAEQRFGAWYVRGGLRRIADALLDRCRERGVAVHLGSEVAGVCTDGGRVSGLRTADGARVGADVVVCGADADLLHRHLLPGRVRPGRAPASLSGFALLLALDAAGDRPPAHRVFFPADHDAEFDAVFARRAAPVADPTVYVHAPDDPALRPDDAAEGWFVLVNAAPHAAGGGPHRVDWDAPGRRERYADHILDVLAARGIDVRRRLRWREVRTPADLERETGSPGGSIYGAASHGLRAALRRPANAGPVPGLFRVGGSAHPGGGLPLVLLSAAIVADLVGRA